MLIRIRKLVLYLLLASLPLQSMAGPAHAFFCDGAQQSGVAGHEHDGGNGHHSHDGINNPGGVGAHDCYHHYFFGVLPSLALHADLAPLAFEPATPAAFFSFFPERLKRPPLARAA